LGCLLCQPSEEGALKNLKVADIFMGGGTTIVEGSRLGMQMYGCDLNPVAWFIVKNEMAKVDPAEVQALLDEIESEVKPQIMPFMPATALVVIGANGLGSRRVRSWTLRSIH